MRSAGSSCMRASSAGVASAICSTRLIAENRDSAALTSAAYWRLVIKCGRRTGEMGRPPSFSAFMRSWSALAHAKSMYGSLSISL